MIAGVICDTLREALYEPGKPGWQDWSTAPEDGTKILAWRKDDGIFMAYFVVEERFAHVGTCWFADGMDLTGDLPTHWMPLSEPPEVEA